MIYAAIALLATAVRGTFSFGQTYLSEKAPARAPPMTCAPRSLRIRCVSASVVTIRRKPDS
jgi:hypothetical protein